MEWSEKDVEDYIAENPWVIECDMILGRQLQVGVGIIDLLALRIGVDKDEKPWSQLVVIELKKDRIDCNAVGQLVRYLHAVQVGTNRVASLCGILVGQSIDTDALLLAEHVGLEYRNYKVQFSVESKKRHIQPLRERLDEHSLKTLYKTSSDVLKWHGQYHTDLPEEQPDEETTPIGNRQDQSATAEEPEGPEDPTD